LIPSSFLRSLSSFFFNWFFDSSFLSRFFIQSISTSSLYFSLALLLFHPAWCHSVVLSSLSFNVLCIYGPHARLPWITLATHAAYFSPQQTQMKPFFTLSFSIKALSACF
jgi:hypothetical protein